MPDPNQNNPTPGRTTDAATDPVSAQAVADAFNRVVPVVKEIATQLEKVADRLDKLEKGADGLGNEMRQAVTYTDQLMDKMKGVYGYQKKMLQSAVKAKDWKEVSDALEKILKQNQTLMAKGVFSKQDAQRVKRQNDEIARSLNQVQGAAGKAFDPAYVRKMSKELDHLAQRTFNVSNAMKRIHQPGVRGDFARAGETVRRVLGLRDRAHKFREYADLHRDIKEARRDSHAGRQDSFDKLRQRIAIRAGQLEFGLDQRGKRGGIYDRTPHPKDWRDFMYHSSRKEGLGRTASYFLGRNSLAAAQGTQPGILTKGAMNLLARGEGSIGRGLASAAGGTLESVIGGMAELAGPLAPVLGTLAAVRELFDKNQARNSAVADGLGKGGMFAGGDPIWAMRNTRANLNGPLYSQLGIGYEKNLSIAKSLSDAGFGTKNLAGEGIGNDRQGFLNGSFGSLQRNVYAYGRLAGLDSSQTMTETLKLVTQYKQSLSSTEDFFIHINKDAAAANITTTKWLQVLDDVQSHYEKSNKLLESTVDTMRLLSVTGRNTAEDIKDSMDALTNGGKTRDLSQSAYLNQAILADPKLRKLQDQAWQTAKTDQLNQVQSIFGADNFNMNDWDKRLMKDPQGTIAQLISQAQARFGDGSLGLQTAKSAIGGLSPIYENLRSLNYAKADGVNRGGVDLAFSQNLSGGNFITQEMQQLAALQKALEPTGLSLKDFLQDTSEFRAKGGYQLAQQAFGGDAHGADKLRQTAIDAASARLTVLDQHNPANNDLADETMDILNKSGAFKFGKGDYEGLQSDLKDNTKRDSMLSVLSESPTSLTDIVDQRILKPLRDIIDERQRGARIADAASLNAGTQTTADITARAFEYLFNRIQTPLDLIAEIMKKLGSFWLHTKVDTAESSGVLGGLRVRIHEGEVKSALETLDKKIALLSDHIAHPTDKDTPDQLQKQLDQARADRQTLSDTADAAMQTGTSSSLSTAAVLKAAAIADANRTQIGPEATKRMLNALGVGDIQDHAGQWRDLNLAQYKAYDKAGAFKGLDPDHFQTRDIRDKNGVEKAQIIYNNFNSVTMTNTPEAQNVVNKAGETATQTKATN